MTFNPDEAVAAVVDAVEKRGIELDDRIERESREAIEVAAKYAQHLADGGDPTKYPEPPPAEDESRWSMHTRLVAFKPELERVYDLYAKGAGKNGIPFSPVAHPKRFKVARYALARIGETMLYADLGDLGASGYGTKMSSEEAATILATLQRTNGRDLVLRRRRVDGKVAYLLRPPKDDEVPVGQLEDDGTPKYKIDPMIVPLEKKAKVAS